MRRERKNLADPVNLIRLIDRLADVRTLFATIDMALGGLRDLTAVDQCGDIQHVAAHAERTLRELIGGLTEYKDALCAHKDALCAGGAANV